MITIDSGCLIENSLLVKSTDKSTLGRVEGLHLVLGVRLVPDYNTMNKHFQTSKNDHIDTNILESLLNNDSMNLKSSFIFVIEIPYDFTLVTSDERKQFPDYGSENNDFQNAVDFEFFEDSTQSLYSSNHFIPNKNVSGL